MESKELKQVLDKYLFVPIKAELAERLHKVILSMTDKIDTNIIENYVCDFYSNAVNISFRGLFDATYNNKYGENPHLPHIVYVILEAYYLRLSFLSDNIDKSLKLQFSYIVKNYAITRKGCWNKVLCPDWIMAIYQYNENHKCVPVKSNAYDQLIKAVMPSKTWSETGLKMSDQSVYEQLRCLCVAGNKERLNDFVCSFTFSNMSSPFAKVYLLVVKMVKEWQWKYVDANPAATIQAVLGDAFKKRKNLGNIANEVMAEVSNTDIYKPTMLSSVLLRRIADGKGNGMEASIFNVLEFGIYLYYEMLLETIND